MSKQDSIKAKGKVSQALGNGTFKVTLDNIDQDIYCTLSGRIRKNFIRILPGDEVEVEMSPYDLTKGRITIRYKGTDTPIQSKPTHIRK